MKRRHLIQLGSFSVLSLVTPLVYDGFANKNSRTIAAIPNHRDIITLECMGSTPGPKWLDGRTGNGTVGLAPQAGENYTGTRWQVYEVDSGIYALKCLGDVDGPRWLDGRTGNGTVGLAARTDKQFSGTRWQFFEISSGVFALKCLGDVKGPRWLDGRTGNSTVGLAPNTPTPDGNFSGATWRVHGS